MEVCLYACMYVCICTYTCAYACVYRYMLYKNVYFGNLHLNYSKLMECSSFPYFIIVPTYIPI